MLGRKVSMMGTSSDHQYIPITTSLLDRSKFNQIFFIKNLQLKIDQKKLELQPNYIDNSIIPEVKSYVILQRLARIKDSEFIKISQELPNSSEIHIIFKRTEPWPIVRFPLESYFNEKIFMDIKEINGDKMLHLIEHGIRYSVSIKIPCKESSEIINAILKHLIAYFGIAQSILTDNNRQFNNLFFRDMAQNLNIVVCTTAAESQRSNGLKEYDNGILGEMLEKTIKNIYSSFKFELAWF